MRMIALLASVFAAFGSCAAYAQLEKGTIAPDIEAKHWLNTDDGEAVSLQDTRGMITVLYFWVSFHAAGKYFFEDLNVFEAGLGVRRGVRVIGLTSGDVKRTEPGLKEKKVFFPVGCESHSDKDYKVEFWPYVVIVDPEGRVAWSGSPADGQEVIRTLEEIIKNNPPTRTHPIAAAVARKKLSEARKAIQEEHYQDAVRAARVAVDEAMTGDTLKTHCQDMVDLLDAIGRDAVAKAESALDKQNWAEAVRELRFVMRGFRGLDCYKAAKEKLDKYSKNNDEVKKLIGQQENAAKARADIRRARSLIEDRKFGEGFVLLESVVEQYGETDEADIAESDLKRLQAEPRVMRDVLDFKASKDCKEWISSARSYIAAKRWTEARKYLRRVLDEYPDSKYADEAMNELVKLPAE